MSPSITSRKRAHSSTELNEDAPPPPNKLHTSSAKFMRLERLEDLTRELKDSKNMNEDLSDQLESALKRAADVEKINASLVGMNKILSRQVQETPGFQAEVASFQQQTGYEDKILDLEEENKTLASEKLKAVEKTEAIEKENAKLRVEGKIKDASYVATLEQLRSEIVDAENERSTAVDRSKQLEAEIIKLDDMLETVRKALKQQHEKCRDYETKVSVMQVQRSSGGEGNEGRVGLAPGPATDATRQAEDQLFKAEEMVGTLSREIQDLKAAMTEAEEQHLTALNTARKKASEFEESLKSEKRRSESCQGEVAALKQGFKDIEKRWREAAKEAADQIQAQLNKTITELNNQLENLQKKYKGSTSGLSSASGDAENELVEARQSIEVSSAHAESQKSAMLEAEKRHMDKASELEATVKSEKEKADACLEELKALKEGSEAYKQDSQRITAMNAKETQLDETISGLNSKLENLQKKYKGSTPGLSSASGDAENELVEARQSIKVSSAHAESQKSAMLEAEKRHMDKASELEATVKSEKEKADACLEELKALKEGSEAYKQDSQRITAMNAKETQLDETISGLNSKLENLQKKYKGSTPGLSSASGDAENELVEARQSIKVSSAHAESQKSAMLEAEKRHMDKASELEATVKSEKEKADGFQKKVKSYEKAYKELKGTTDTKEAQLRKRISELQTEKATLEKEVSEKQGRTSQELNTLRIETLNGTNSKLLEEKQELQSKITELEKSMDGGTISKDHVEISRLKKELEAEREASFSDENARLLTNNGALDVGAIARLTSRYSRTSKEIGATRRIHKLGPPVALPDAQPPAPNPWLRQKTKGKRKAKQPRNDESNSESSESSDDDSTDGELDLGVDLGSDDKEESDDSRVLAAYAKLQPPTDHDVLLGRNKGFRRTERNRLVRGIILEALPARYTKEIWHRQTVPTSRLEQFIADPRKYPPKIRNTWVHRNGTSTDEIRNSQWNQSLVHVLSQLAKDVAEHCPDKTRFGKSRSAEYWIRAIQQRFDRIYVEIHRSKPMNAPEATNPILVQSRLNRENEKRLTAAIQVSSRVAKYNSRSDNASHMLEQYKNKANPTPEDLVELEFWTYIFSVIETLGHDGMSDEEGEDEEEIMDGGLPTTRHVRKVLVLPWRHPSLQQLVQFVDQIPQEESLLFKQTGRHPMYPRQRIDKQSSRKSIPKGLHVSFFNPDYMTKLTSMERFKLKVKNDGVALRELAFEDR
ncbi:hypothetical protein VNI00_013480 [Paramarasmius palmivorus]|uniref:Uncharacterized protein n=1 Tax=Paramarasmius palmivorus TaxID=297713 RepID=A0AAW0C2C5_9AGAR